jgi:hypothetical protein
MPSEPFHADDVLFRFEPTEEEHGLFDEYAAVRSSYDPRCLLFFAKTRTSGAWVESGYFAVAIIAHLLTDLDAIKAYIGTPGGPSYEELVKENERLAADRNQLAHLAIDNELVERELIASSHLREPEAKDWRQKLSHGLRVASNLARRVLGNPSIREEVLELGAQRREGK